MLPQQQNGYKRKLNTLIQDSINALYSAAPENMESYQNRLGYISGLYAALELFESYLIHHDENGDF